MRYRDIYRWVEIDKMGDAKSDLDSKTNAAETPTIEHEESAQESKWKTAKPADGDVAMALFSDPTDLHEDVDPVEMRKLIWKIDFMILPYLAVCYAFFYIDKVNLKLIQAIGVC